MGAKAGHDLYGLSIELPKPESDRYMISGRTFSQICIPKIELLHCARLIVFGYNIKVLRQRAKYMLPISAL